MNPTAALPKQSFFLKLAGKMLTRLSGAAPLRPRARYVNIGEFSPHLQRDMGFLDGRRTPAPETCPGEGRSDARDLAARDRMR